MERRLQVIKKLRILRKLEELEKREIRKKRAYWVNPFLAERTSNLLEDKLLDACF